MKFLIVGAGLAGTTFARYVEQNGHPFHIISDDSYQASRTAAGVYNPVILKRFTAVADAQVHLDAALPFFQGEHLHVVTLLRRLYSVEEQNNWYVAADKPALKPFLDPSIEKCTFEGVNAPFGYGKVLTTGYLNTNAYLDEWLTKWEKEGKFSRLHFLYKQLQFHANSTVEYNGQLYDYVVFAEGVGIQQNPYFNYLPLLPAKGEVLTLRIPALQLDAIVKAGVFILPLGNDLYKVGATYNWDQKDELPTVAARKELLTALEEFLEVPYEVVEHKAGLRPTVKDRRPLIGVHPQFKSLALLNGLGTRGVMLAPTCAEMLYRHLVHNESLLPNYDLNRYAAFWPADRNAQKY